jgi:HPt (histidine-containing phosphotransfer) domain-containing protein
VRTAEQTAIPDRLVSGLLLDDPDMLDLVEEFVRGLSECLDEFRRAFEQLDWDRLTRLAHQLKGAAASYGYAEISRLASKMEAGFQVHSAAQFAEWMATFEKLTTAARAGLQPD